MVRLAFKRFLTMVEEMLVMICKGCSRGCIFFLRGFKGKPTRG